MIKINEENIRIRPSSIDTFFGCAYQWAKTHLEGIPSIPNSRAAIGTAIHFAAEQMWSEAIESGKKDPNQGMMTDAAIESWQEQVKEGVSFGDGEDSNTCAAEVIKGTDAFREDIVPFAVIPRAVETEYKVAIDHPLVAEVGGTVDYITPDTIADLKTSKRKSGTEGYKIQQSTYKYLANANGEKIENNLIQQVVMKKQPEGNIQILEPDIDQAKFLINTILDTLELVHEDVAPIHTILRPNPKYMFCDPKYCNHYHSCPAITGKL